MTDEKDPIKLVLLRQLHDKGIEVSMSDFMDWLSSLSAQHNDCAYETLCLEILRGNRQLLTRLQQRFRPLV